MQEETRDPDWPNTSGAQTGQLASARAPEKGKATWGLFLTLVFSLLVVIVYGIAQGVGATLIIISRAAGKVDIQSPQFQKLLKGGDPLAVGSVLAFFLGTGAILLLIKWRKGLTTPEYLGWSFQFQAGYLFWFLGALLLIALSDFTSYSLGYPLIHDFAIKAFTTTTGPLYHVLLVLAIVLIAPLFEEMMFRGFMFEGLRRSAPGAAGAIFITAGIWAVIHLQYEFYYLVHIFVLGLYLGYIRHKTGSLILTWILHALMNLISTVKLYIFLEYFQKS